MKILIRKILRKVGFDLIRYQPLSHPQAREIKLLADLAPTVVIDVGAAYGEYATALREGGYTGRILSFEPRVEAFETLRSKAKRDSNWEVFPFALGRESMTSEINISGNACSSSILTMKDLHVEASPGSDTKRKETIEIRTLDQVWPELNISASDRVLLKLDVQGYEFTVLQGGEKHLDEIIGVYLELSLQPLYEGAPHMEDLMAFLRKIGFFPVSLAPTFSNSVTCHLLQVDGLFIRHASRD